MSTFSSFHMVRARPAATASSSSPSTYGSSAGSGPPSPSKPAGKRNRVKSWLAAVVDKAAVVGLTRASLFTPSPKPKDQHRLCQTGNTVYIGSVAVPALDPHAGRRPWSRLSDGSSSGSSKTIDWEVHDGGKTYEGDFLWGLCMSYRKASKAAKKDKRRAKREDRRAEKEAIKRPAVDDQGHCRCWECLVTYPGLRTHNRSGL